MDLVNKEEPKLDFSSLYNYVKSFQLEAGMTDEEAGTVYHVLLMWDKKRYIDNTEFKKPISFNTLT